MQLRAERKHSEFECAVALKFNSIALSVVGFSREAVLAVMAAHATHFN
jgi:hypothetical protein